MEEFTHIHISVSKEEIDKFLQEVVARKVRRDTPFSADAVQDAENLKITFTDIGKSEGD